MNRKIEELLDTRELYIDSVSWDEKHGFTICLVEDTKLIGSDMPSKLLTRFILVSPERWENIKSLEEDAARRSAIKDRLEI